MTIDRLVMAFAGGVILLSLALTFFVHPNFWWLTAFVGANMFQAAFTGFCPLAKMLKKIGAQPGAAFN
ncbi:MULTISPECIES: YgaP family membrane protein [Terasakiella]|uniref:Membrane protein n=1 Tax=Terasakiella brassicae TaxID=1634917 RepID=A0A917BXG3_9PROT|nr:DUF2892 domain-containing protein [Terasakiella brassicae]GGF60501.1 membrane protein [Terasakiella brassicae]